MSEYLIYIPVFIVLLVPLMLIHELGHFWGAKAAGIRVEEFGLGFPPRAIKLFERDGTIYSLNWLPIGAFVRMTGEDDPNDPKSLAAAPKRWRLITLFAGPFMNFIGAFLIFISAHLFFFTRPTDYQYRIQSVLDGSVAQQVGIKPGDVVLSVDDKSMIQTLDYTAADDRPLMTNQPLREGVLAAENREIVVRVARPADPTDLKSPTTDVELRAKLPNGLNREAPLGVSLALQVTKAERVNLGLVESVRRATADFGRIISSIINLPAELSRRNVPLEQARPVSVVGITRMGVSLIQDRDVQGIFPFVYFAGFISFALGMTNLLPLPALDGGRIVFVLIEWIRGKRIDPVRQQWVHGIGLIMLMGLSLLMMVLDVVKPVTP